MEIVFLLAMFDRDRPKIKEWRKSDRKTRMKTFQPGKDRSFLDTYDGFTGGTRDGAYQMFCEYAAHATWQGFALMGPLHKPTIGPFFDRSLMKAVMVELAQLAAQSGNNFASFVDGKSTSQRSRLNYAVLEKTDDPVGGTLLRFGGRYERDRQTETNACGDQG